MAKEILRIEVDEGLRKEAEVLFSRLGLDLDTAVNLFLRQCVLRGELPFTAEDQHFSKKTLEAMAEAERLAEDPSAKSYGSVEELKAALES